MRRLGGLVLIMTLMEGVSSATAEEQTLSFGRLGTVTLYRQSPHPSHVILFLSGDSGWNMLPRVGHGFSVPRNWLPQLKQVFSGLTDRQTAEQRPVNLDLKDLPLVERPAGGEPRPLLAVLVTGDGGWAGIDQEIASALVAAGVGVVGLNSLKYFWTPRTPESASRDLGRILAHYLANWKKTGALLVGYSRGADVLPFMLAGLPEDLRRRVRALALLGPGKAATFEFHVSDWIGGGPRAAEYPLLPEIGKLGDTPVLCFYGWEESDSLCREKLPASVSPIVLSGGHHFDGRYDVIIDRILQTLP